jgi:hypothetical protein
MRKAFRKTPDLGAVTDSDDRVSTVELDQIRRLRPIHRNYRIEAATPERVRKADSSSERFAIV